ncbi:LysR family transcriptional regulator [Cupriavidus necator]|uniref:LysR family transcriptional regulator n=1 Tax=Cupriavidus necator TaxID=106590 RepID=A0A367P7H7_CUPNE|nr:LysR family transcriptional regulator [Cupriavidus necator]RCJ03789.1 LysR family transcriptional regulator [Cupriavidus necator]
MTLQQLETFYWIVQLDGFAAAAERLCATQSTVSMRLRELERSLGVELFDRTQRKARLTPRGREVFDYATRILNLSSELSHRVAAPDSVSGTIRIGVAEVVSISWLPALIKRIAKEYPQVRLEIDEALTSDLMNALAQGELDLVLAPGHTHMHDVSAISLGTVDFAWMASPGLAARHIHSPAELAQYPIIGLKPQSFHSAAIDAWFLRDHAHCRYLARCKSMGVAASLAIAGMGVTYLPVPNYQRQLGDGLLEIIEVRNPFDPVEFVAAVSPEHTYSLPSAIAELAQSVSEFQR